MSGKLTISTVPLSLLDHMFPKCIPEFQKVVEQAPNDLSIATIREDLYSGRKVLVTVSEGEALVAAHVLEICTYDTGHKVLVIPVIGGTRMEEWMDDFMEMAMSIAKDHGCDELRGMACRKGWLRALKSHDWYDIHAVIGCKVK